MGFFFRKKETTRVEKTKIENKKMEKENKEECYCTSFEKGGISPEKVFKKFKVLFSSGSNKPRSPEEGEFTSLLKCYKCDSYYLMDVCDPSNSNSSNLPIKRYYPKVEEIVLIKTLKSLEGIITIKEFDECCDLTLTVLNVLNKNKK
jgi:hypothetical protein